MFDAFWWGRGPGANRTVQKEFIRFWADTFPEDELVLALRKDADASDVPAGAEVVRTRLWPHAFANRWELPRLSRASRADVSVVHNYAPRSGRSVVFVHDAMFHDNPEWFSRRERLYFAPMLPWARRASVVTTSTETEARRISRLVPQLAPIAVGLGVPTALTDAAPRRPAAVPEGSEFAVTVGRLNVRKNLAAVIDGARLAAAVTPQTPLYIVGGSAHSGVSTELPAALRSAVVEGRVVFLGALDDDEVAWLYSRASLVVSLSLDEGFGLPAVEAAGFGAPLLASDIAVFRETVGDYADFVSPTASAHVVASAIDGAWGRRPDAAIRDAVVARYSWRAAVERLREAAVAR
ncbi:glycosyltransferase family 4 protein [Microbacterium sp. NPDC077663]|uniref:glycosyltransferase family 4 protein n=1 Tax=Microbacterium sp. NPDC077663 TaxID=3364189 RepID=UPI0037C80961